jgi:hypothetical protein
MSAFDPYSLLGVTLRARGATLSGPYADDHVADTRMDARG